jgi:dipeptidyl aminopeptidase/acylaminoacyl peptidase
MWHEEEVTSAQFSPDGTRIATVSKDFKGRVWDSRKGQSLGEPIRGMASAQFSPDGFRLVTVAGNGARIVDAPFATNAAPEWFISFLEICAEAMNPPSMSPRSFTNSPANIARDWVRRHADDTVYGRVAKWVVADLSTRTISPFSAITVPEYLARVPEKDPASVRQALDLCPTNALLLARLAFLCSSNGRPWANSPVYGDPDFLSGRAVQFAPNDPVVLGLRREILRALPETQRRSALGPK